MWVCNFILIFIYRVPRYFIKYTVPIKYKTYIFLKTKSTNKILKKLFVYICQRTKMENKVILTITIYTYNGVKAPSHDYK